jgi:hypothetical protein
MFDAAAAGKVERLTLRRNGRDHVGVRLEHAIGKALSEAADKRLTEQMPDPRSEAALHRHIVELQSTTPEYDHITAEFADTLRQRLPELTEYVRQLGRLQRVRFRRASAGAVDSYLAVFENGWTEWAIGLASDGRTASLLVQPD